MTVTIIQTLLAFSLYLIFALLVLVQMRESLYTNENVEMGGFIAFHDERGNSNILKILVELN